MTIRADEMTVPADCLLPSARVTSHGCSRAEDANECCCTNAEDTKFPVAPQSNRITAGLPLTKPLSLNKLRVVVVSWLICEHDDDDDEDKEGDRSDDHDGGDDDDSEDDDEDEFDDEGNEWGDNEGDDDEGESDE